MTQPTAHDLLLDFDELRGRLAALTEVAPGGERWWLDIFLLASGLEQILEDYVHGGGADLAKAAALLGNRANAAARTAAAVAARGSDLRFHLRWARRRGALGGVRGDLRTVSDGAAEMVVAASPAGLPADLLARIRALAAADLPVPLLRGVLKLPTSFRSLDQRPGDCGRLAALFAAGRPDRERAILVVGVRTSGSYLAPLCAAHLRGIGYQRVTVMTIRPGRPPLPEDVAGLRAAAEAGALCLLCDDPPKTGRALALAAREMQSMGFDRAAIILGVALFGAGSTLPQRLRQYETYALPWERWSIHDQLDPAAVEAALRPVFAAREETIKSVERLALPMAADPRSGAMSRRHVRALYRLKTAQRRRTLDRLVYVKGTGTGWLGDHSGEVAAALSEFVPEVYAARDGLMYRRWLPDQWRVSLSEPETCERLLDTVPAYVLARSTALAVREDVSVRLGPDGPLWKLTSDFLGRGFGRAGIAARPVTMRAARYLLRTDRPSVVDASMGVTQWFAAPDTGRVLKVDFDERAFANQDSAIDQVFCYDALFDLAAAAADLDSLVAIEGTENLAESLRRRYARIAGAEVDAERWLLYQLLHLDNFRRYLAEIVSETGGPAAPTTSAETAPLAPGMTVAELAAMSAGAERALARSHQRYFSETFLSALEPSLDGPVWAIDIDGVLETRELGHPALTPAGAIALRALLAHGFRPVLVTGRSLAEVRERCSNYRLPGGVAEYGAIAYDHSSDQAVHLAGEEARSRMDAVRAALAVELRVVLDPAYSVVVRARFIGEDGASRPLAQDLVQRALDRAGACGRVVVVHGESQSDFVDQSLDKGTGLAGLLSLLDRTSGSAGSAGRVAVAIGDTLTDLPMFARADRSYAPANADPQVKAAAGAGLVRLMASACQAGLGLAVKEVLGHAPGACPRCSLGATDRRRKVLLTLLSAQDEGPAGKLRRIAQAGRLLRLVSD